MASRGLLGGLAGLGQGIAEAGRTAGEALKFEYLQKVQEQQRQKDRDYQEQVRAEDRNYQDAVRSDEREFRQQESQKDREWKDSVYDKQHEQAIELATVKASTKAADPTDKVNAAKAIVAMYKDKYPEDLSAADQSMLEGAKKVLAGSAGFEADSTAPKGYTEAQLSAADDYAKDRVSSKAGLLSRDKTDFEEFGGDRDRAYQAYRQQYLDNLAANTSAPDQESPIGRGAVEGEGVDVQSMVERVLKSNPGKDEDWAKAYLKHLGKL